MTDDRSILEDGPISLETYEGYRAAGAKVLSEEIVRDAWRMIHLQKTERHGPDLLEFGCAIRVWAGILVDFGGTTRRGQLSHARLRDVILPIRPLNAALLALTDREREEIWNETGDIDLVEKVRSELYYMEKAFKAVIERTASEVGPPNATGMRSAVKELATTWAWFVGRNTQKKYKFGISFLEFCETLLPPLALYLDGDTHRIGHMVKKVITEWNKGKIRPLDEHDEQSGWYCCWLTPPTPEKLHSSDRRRVISAHSSRRSGYGSLYPEVIGKQLKISVPIFPDGSKYPYDGHVFIADRTVASRRNKGQFFVVEWEGKDIEVPMAWCQPINEDPDGR
jgi:hypothetical protein